MTCRRCSHEQDEHLAYNDEGLLTITHDHAVLWGACTAPGCECSGCNGPLNVDLYYLPVMDRTTFVLDGDKTALDVALAMVPQLETWIDSANLAGKELVRVSFAWFNDGERARHWQEQDDEEPT